MPRTEALALNYPHQDVRPVAGVDIEKQKEKKDPMDNCWGAFGQVLLVREMMGMHGKPVKKIAAVSIAYPPEVSKEMGAQIARKTLGVELPEIMEWSGEQRGELLSVTNEMPDDAIDLSIFDRLVNASSQVIDTHPRRDHQHVQDYFDLEKTRKERGLALVKRDAQRVFDTPELIGINAMNDEYKGAGLYFLEYYLDEQGELWGVDPTGKPSLLKNIPKDAPHQSWINYLIGLARKPGNRNIFDFDSTETVSECGGAEDGVKTGGCSEFFELMEGKSVRGHTIFSSSTTEFSYQSGYVLPILMISTDSEYCKKCKNFKTGSKKECKCSVEAAETFVLID